MAIGEVLGFMEMANKIRDSLNNEIGSGEAINAIKFASKRNQSISAKAAKSMCYYPILVSSNFGDEDTLIKVSKFLEIQYSLFTLISLGLSPYLIGNETIDDKLLNIGTDELHTEEGKNKIKKLISGNYDIKIGFEGFKNTYVEVFTGNNYKGKDFNMFIDPKKTKNYESMKKQLFKNMDDYRNNFLKNKEKVSTEQESDEYSDTNIEEPETSKLGNLSGAGRDLIERKLAAGSPTVLSFTFKKGNSESQVYLAVKTLVKLVPSQEMIDIFKRTADNKPFIKLIKLTTGEISFFKDFVLNIKEIQKNNELYEKMGRYPWYDALIKRKKYRLFNFLFSIFTKLFTGQPWIKPVLPIHTILCDPDEIQFGFGKKLKLLMNDNKIRKQIDNLMLLCLGTYDSYKDKFVFLFNGMKEPYGITEKEMGKIGGTNTDVNSDMAKAIYTLLKKQ